MTPQGKNAARHKTLMASVAGVALAVLLSGPGVFKAANMPTFTGSAVAAETMLAAVRLRRHRRQGEAGSDLGTRPHGCREVREPRRQ